MGNGGLNNNEQCVYIVNALRVFVTYSMFICRYTFRSGNAEHPSDRLYNTTVEVLPVTTTTTYDTYNTTADGFVIVG